MRRNERNHPAILSPEAFKQTLHRYLTRHARGGFEVAVLCVELTDVPVFRRRHGGELSENVADACLSACLKNLRQEDRICLLSSHIFLVLLPDASLEGANRAAERLEKTAAGANHRNHGIAYRSGVATRVAHSSTFPGASVDSLLNAVDITFDEHGELVQRSTAGQPEIRVGGDLIAWIERYVTPEGQPVGDSPWLSTAGFEARTDSKGMRAVDTWRDTEVEINALAQPNVPSFDWAEAQKRARTLQACRHDALVALNDFFVDYQVNRMFLVSDCVDATPLAAAVGEEMVPLERAIDWIEIILSALLYLQSLVPSAVPRRLATDNVFLRGDKLIVMNFEIDYILGSAAAEPCRESPVPSIAALLCWILERTDLPDLAVVQSLQQAAYGSPPETLNTIYKIRSSLSKELAKAAAAMEMRHA